MSDPHVHDSLAGKNVRVETYSRDIDVVTKDEAVGQFHEHQVERSDVGRQFLRQLAPMWMPVASSAMFEFSIGYKIS